MPLATATSTHSLTNLDVQLSKCFDNQCKDRDLSQNNYLFSFSEKVKIVLKNITIEPIVALCFLSSSVSILAAQNLVLEKGCRVNLALGEDTCDALSTTNESYPGYKENEEKVQILSASMLIWRDVTMGIMPCVLFLFIGSWSDRHNKRKYIILNNTLGDIATTVCFLICTYFFYQLPLQVNILGEALPPVLTGGLSVASMGIFSYISSVSSERTRTIRIGAVHILITAVMCIGTLISGILYQKIGFYGVFSTSLFLYTSGYFYGVFFVTDIWVYEANKGDVVSEIPQTCFLKDFFNFKNVSQTFKLAFKKREDDGRKKICFLLILVILTTGPFRSEINLTYYYLKLKFGWSPVEYSLFLTFQFIIYIFGNMIGLLIFTKCLKLDDCLLGIIACVSKILSNLMYALSPSPIYILVAGIMDLFSGLSQTVLRSIGSKMVPPDELGKFYSLFGFAETVAPLVMCPIYNKMYAETIRTMPGMFYLVSIGLYSPAILIFAWLYCKLKKEQKRRLRQGENLLGTAETQ